jgi:predicted HicB family RNase H-like nuclease
MSIGTASTTMAEKRGRGRPETGRNDVTVRVDAEVIRSAKIVASYESKSLAEYLSDVLRPIVDRDHKKHAARAVKPGGNE